MAFLDEKGLAELWSIITEWGATDETIAMYGLNEHATPNTIFQKLAMPYGYYGFDITVQLPDGTPVSGVVLNGLEDFKGNTAETDENGRCATAVSTETTVTVTINNHVGIIDNTYTVNSTDEYAFTPNVITVQPDSDLRLITTSGEYRVVTSSPVDLCALGGGGNGGTGADDVGAGGGGGGGYIENLLETTLSSNILKISIGAGGGGSTTIADENNTILSAAGGANGAGGYHRTGGAGNGSGGNGGSNIGPYGTAGGAATGAVFNDASLGIKFGGGGGGGGFSKTQPGGGGSPFGGNGGGGDGVQGYAATGYGGGGGGGSFNGSCWGGAGYQGFVYVRVRYAQ